MTQMTRVHMDDALAGLDVDFFLKLWKHNKVDEEYDLRAVALMTGFRAFAEGYDNGQRAQWGSERMLIEYLTMNEADYGLESAVAFPWRTGADRKREGGPDSLTTDQWAVLVVAAQRIVWPATT